MDITNATSAMSSSLTARSIYCVCCPERDGLDCLHGELTEARKKFFAGGRRTVKPENPQIIKGFEGKLQGKLSRHGLFWKKTAGGVVLEEAFDQRRGYVVVRRDFRNVIVSRTFFDRDHFWIRSEYYEPGDAVNPRVTFKPQENTDGVLRLEREPGGNAPHSTELFPTPYRPGTAEQSIVNARFGEPGLVISTAEGDFCYCPKKEARDRLRTLEEIKEGSIVLMPAWEVRDGALAQDPDEGETDLNFTSLEEYARVEPGKAQESPAASLSAPPAEEEEDFSPARDPEEKPAQEPSEDELILEAARKAAEEPETAAEETEVSGVLPQTVRNGKVLKEGKAAADLPLYRGESRDGKREGFGSYYYQSGPLCYAGFWKDGKKHGLGVSFRESDHALHIAKWENGKPVSPVSLFDKNGALRYSGQFENGKKQGAGVSFRPEDGTIFVGKWENGVPASSGASFDREGNLRYYGGWKDGKRSGRGTEFDSQGAIVFDGEWKDGKYHNGILYQKLSQGKQ